MTSEIPLKPEIAAKNGLNPLDMSFNWYTTVGALIVFIVAVPLSYILPPEKGTKFDPKLLSPIVQPFANYELTEMEEVPEVPKS